MSEKPNRILITGGSGMVGTRLSELLIRKGRQVVHLSRSPEKRHPLPVEVFGWDIAKRWMDPEALEGVEAIVHLAGAGIADSRWTDKRKKELIDSRVASAELVYDYVVKYRKDLKCFVSASGIDYYGTYTGEHILEESDPPSDDFIGRLCVRWEEAAMRFGGTCRVVVLRTSTVLSKRGGALPRLALPVRWGVGAALGSGKQYMPYIHIDDLCRMYIHALDNPKVEGAFNATNGDHITNAEFTRQLASVWDKPLWMPNIPAMFLKTALGEMAEIVLQGSRASADKIISTGFEFLHGHVASALSAIYRT